MIIHRLTVDGKDYFLPSPIDTLKASILEAITACGGYVTVSRLRGGPTPIVDTGFDAEKL